MQTSVRTDITVNTGVIAGRHLVVLLVILLCFFAARADVCENRYYSEYWCDRWAELGECDANPDWMYNNCYRSCACTDPGKSSLLQLTLIRFIN